MKRLILSFVFTIASFTSSAATYECNAEWAGYLSEIAKNGFQVADKQYLKKLQLMVRITDGVKTKLERCSFVKSADAITCDAYEVDVEHNDKNTGMRKLYITPSQYDIQLITLRNNKIMYIENNGRGGISTGECQMTRP
jgi:hypothetical protein